MFLNEGFHFNKRLTAKLIKNNKCWDIPSCHETTCCICCKCVDMSSLIQEEKYKVLPYNGIPVMNSKQCVYQCKGFLTINIQSRL